MIRGHDRESVWDNKMTENGGCLTYWLHFRRVRKVQSWREVKGKNFEKSLLTVLKCYFTERDGAGTA